jgi:hypothetical protein
VPHIHREEREVTPAAGPERTHGEDASPPDLLWPTGASVSAAVAHRRWDTTASQRRSEAGSATGTPPAPDYCSTGGTK